MKNKVKKILFSHSIYRLVIRNIQGYGTFPSLSKGTVRACHLSPQLDQLKKRVLDCLLQRSSKRKVKLLNWSIAWQTHQGSGLPHLDILLVFQRNAQLNSTSFDYLIKDLKIQQKDVGDQVGVGHVWVTPYSSKKLSKAILEYSQKEDPQVLSNLTLQTKDDLVRINRLKANPYRNLQLQMLKDPLHFNLQQYVRSYDLAQYLSNWSSIKTKLKDMQTAAANLQLKTKPGFKLIDRALIQSQLTSQQIQLYDSWSGYQTIVDYLNQIVAYGYKRPMKTLNLLISGLPNTGKTSLFLQDLNRTYTCVQNFCAVYPMGTRTWWPNYRSQVYKLIYWNQAKLTSYSYDTILKVLEGSQVDLPYKGGSVLKYDNPLVIMSSNMTLEQMILEKFNNNPHYAQMAKKNLAVRVHNVVIPPGHDLFLLQKLLVSN